MHRKTAAVTILIVCLIPVCVACAPVSPSTEPSPYSEPTVEKTPEGTAITAYAGQLIVTTTPPGASVLVDGRLLGQTPLKVTLEPGQHVLSLTLEHYEDSQTVVQVTQNEAVTVSRQLHFQPFELAVVEANLKPSERIGSIDWIASDVLVYAIQPRAAQIYGARPYEWRWRSFSLLSQESQDVSPPLAPISQSLLIDLGILPDKASFSVSSDGTELIYTVFDECKERYCFRSDGYCVLGDCPVWRARSDGTGRIQLGSTPTPGTMAYWSPQNDWAIVFSWEEAGGVWGYLARVDGTYWGEMEAFANLTDAFACVVPPSFSPDGKWVVVDAQSSTSDCACTTWVVNMDDRSAIELENGKECTRGPVHWSEDSRHLYLLQSGLLFRYSVGDRFVSWTALAGKIPYPNPPDEIAVSPDETMVALGNMGVSHDLTIVQFAPKW